MTGDTIRREDLIEWSGLPVGKTCALCGNSPGPGRVKWWKEADKPGIGPVGMRRVLCWHERIGS